VTISGERDQVRYRTVTSKPWPPASVSVGAGAAGADAGERV